MLRERIRSLARRAAGLPMCRDVPERSAGLCLGVGTAQADVAQNMIVEIRQVTTFTTNTHQREKPGQQGFCVRRGMSMPDADKGCHAVSPSDLVMLWCYCIIHVDVLIQIRIFVKRMIVRIYITKGERCPGPLT
jgi:hypothetical protein